MRTRRENFWGGVHVLITGGAGFIGSNLTRALVKFGAKVAVIDSLAPDCGGNLFNLSGVEDSVRTVTADMRDDSALSPLVEDAVFLFNLAGRTSHLDSMHAPLKDLEMNCTAQLSLLETVRRRNPRVKIVHSGTRQIYGRPVSLPVGEGHPVDPVDVNGVNKAACERYHLLYGSVHGLRVCSLRLTNTYGPRMRIKDARQTFLGKWIRLALEGRRFEVWGGGQLRDFTYVDDAVDALLLAAESGRAEGGVFNLGGTRPHSLAETAAILAGVTGARFRTVEFPSDQKKIDIGDYHADFSRARETLGWVPRVQLRDGLEKTVDFFRRHLEHYL